MRTDADFPRPDMGVWIVHVLMLGWEFPPFITGGLGTACFGLTKALDRLGVEVTFVLPKNSGPGAVSHLNLISPGSVLPRGASEPIRVDHPGIPGSQGHIDVSTSVEFKHARFIGIDAGFDNPYQQAPGEPLDITSRHSRESLSAQPGTPGSAGWSDSSEPGVDVPHLAADYGGDIVSQSEQYARFCLAATRGLKFDVIHAHDWMTYPAGLYVAGLTGKPLIVHVHSTEFDRSGEHVNQRIYDIERRGMHGALRVVTVSQLTANTVMQRYGVPEKKIEVVYNGVDIEPSHLGMKGIRSKDKIVLYFGRITHQKGPEYFIRAARRVLDHMSNVKFVVAGSGDMAQGMIEMAANLGIGHKVLFTGFLRGNDIKRVFKLADLYVMPSVSEPFGIAPLEAMSNDVPALISKSSGVSEVLTHALKVDFWDIDDMANKVIAVLRHPPLSQTLRTHGAFEVRRLTWDGAAQRCRQIYEGVAADMCAPARV
jgi:glycosyltransferase involved in cell wall biosynthesis